MKETNIKIEAYDKNNIIGVLNEPANKTNNLVIFYHGVTGHVNEHIIYNSTKYFTSNNYATFRFYFYSDEEQTRKFKNIDLKINVSDLNAVINYMCKEFANIYLVGHSLGGLISASADLEKINSLVLWDPSVGNIKFSRIKLKGRHILDWGIEYLVGSKLYKDVTKNLTKNYGNINKPTLIILAGSGYNKEFRKKAVDFINNPNKKVKVIKNAGHTFDELGTEEELFRYTINWFNRWI